MKTICPKCKAINDTNLGELDTYFFEEEPYRWYLRTIMCFFCGESYNWCENLHRKWIGVPVPGWVKL